MVCGLTFPFYFYLLYALLRLVSKLMTATKSAEPMIDQMMGNDFPPILTGNNSGSPSFLAIHSPMLAPMKPSAMETSQPPREKPLMAWPSAPHKPATSSKINKSMRVRAPPQNTEVRSQNSE
ncbi:MAG TPA: hypothetical protein VEQ40_09330 [Pyrinomonadaceae bacterium]|nr:hypothetical protein [Pyrinomonadaceae bacterium]